MVAEPDKAETGDNTEPRPAEQEVLLGRRRRFQRKFNTWVGGPLPALFTAFVIATILAGLGVLADGVAGPVLTVFWWYIGMLAVAQTIGVLVLAGTGPDDRTARCRPI